MREYRARKAEEALGAEHSDKERERQIRREARAELERVKLEQQRREHTLRKELEACQDRDWPPARPAAPARHRSAPGQLISRACRGRPAGSLPRRSASGACGRA
ncbi:hypothetical protein P4054_25695 [Pseudomonas aeruginosa]|nr:hypothetical protein [Pseudomonas aeruginosa]